jgi:hypothetical protein
MSHASLAAHGPPLVAVTFVLQRPIVIRLACFESRETVSAPQLIWPWSTRIARSAFPATRMLGSW